MLTYLIKETEDAEVIRGLASFLGHYHPAAAYCNCSPVAERMLRALKPQTENVTCNVPNITRRINTCLEKQSGGIAVIIATENDILGFFNARQLGEKRKLKDCVMYAVSSPSFKLEDVGAFFLMSCGFGWNHGIVEA